MTKTSHTTPQPNYPDQILGDKPQPGAEHAALFAADLRGIEQEARELPEPSPTAGMNLGQRILHVGGRENAAGYIEFGSVAAVRALVGQVLRDLHPAQPQQIAEPEGLAEVSKEQYARMFGAACEALGQISDHLGIDSDINPGAEPIIDAIDELRAASLQAAPPAPEAVAVPGALVSDARRLAYVADQVRALEAEGSDSDVFLTEAAGVLRACAERIAALAAVPAPAQCVTIDFKQATELLAMFGGEPTEVTLIEGDGHSGAGLYASYTDMPEEGSNFLGAHDDEAVPAAPAQAVAVPADAQAPEQWVDDPHDIEQGMMLNPEWVRAQEHATQLAGQAVARIRAVDEFGPYLDWFKHWVNFPAGTLLHVHAAPIPAKEDARAVDADGEAFRTAANLGLALRLYGGCAQSGMPGLVSVYEVEPGADRAEAMRAAINRAAARAAQGGA